MSRNNLVGVVRHAGRYHVLANLNADTEWNYAVCVRMIERRRFPSKQSRALALLKAHKTHNRIQTEYGVREIFP